MAFSSASAESAVVRVPADEPTIQEGISAAESGDTVLVYPGTYSGPLNRDTDFGGAKVVLRGVAGPELTVIDCEHAGRAFLFQSGEEPTTIVEGFTITGGRGRYGDGGAILCEDSSPTIRSCVFEANGEVRLKAYSQDKGDT